MALQSTSRGPGHRCGFEELAAIFAQIYVAAERRSGGNSLTPRKREGKPSRGWVFRFERQGPERGMWLGSYPELSLAEAREIRDKERKLLRAGKDPDSASRPQSELCRIYAELISSYFRD